MPARPIDSSKNTVKTDEQAATSDVFLPEGSASMSEVCTQGIETGFVALGYAMNLLEL